MVGNEISTRCFKKGIQFSNFPRNPNWDLLQGGGSTNFGIQFSRGKNGKEIEPISAAGCEGEAWSQTDGHWNNARNESHTWEAAMSWYGTLVHWSEIFGRYFWSGNPSDFFRERIYIYIYPIKNGKWVKNHHLQKGAGRDMLVPRRVSWFVLEVAKLVD